MPYSIEFDSAEQEYDFEKWIEEVKTLADNYKISSELKDEGFEQGDIIKHLKQDIEANTDDWLDDMVDGYNPEAAITSFIERHY